MSSPSSTKSVQVAINITPLIDVLLVLLIIFLVLMPAMMRLEQVALPPNEPGVDPGSPVVLKLNADLTVAIDDTPAMSRGDMMVVLAPKVRAGTTVFVDAAGGVAWGEVVGLVDSVRGLARDPNHDEVKVAVRIRETTGY